MITTVMITTMITACGIKYCIIFQRVGNQQMFRISYFHHLVRVHVKKINVWVVGADHLTHHNGPVYLLSVPTLQHGGNFVEATRATIAHLLFLLLFSEICLYV